MLDLGAPTALQRAPSPGDPARPGPLSDTAAGQPAGAGARATPPTRSKPSPLAEAARYLRDPRRRVPVVFGLICLVGILVFGVYAVLEGPPPRVEAVVVFTAQATEAQKDAVRAACPTVGGAVQEPPDRNDLAITRVYPLRYNLTDASTGDRAKVFACVQGRPGVEGITTQTQGQ
ncbi:hypothetical protein [Frankia nepalensis]|uniref:hypothetical protein n=1 Tax=Frankia nepalensis TaxID=1836974 RepID=UPI0027DBE71B|nr:hypothetical protein [Frankia nepalensis]